MADHDAAWHAQADGPGLYTLTGYLSGMGLAVSAALVNSSGLTKLQDSRDRSFARSVAR
jgi:hypothetical protein